MQTQLYHQGNVLWMTYRLRDKSGNAASERIWKHLRDITGYKGILPFAPFRLFHFARNEIERVLSHGVYMYIYMLRHTCSILCAQLMVWPQNDSDFAPYRESKVNRDDQLVHIARIESTVDFLLIGNDTIFGPNRFPPKRRFSLDREHNWFRKIIELRLGVFRFHVSIIVILLNKK